jgi:hypothetical protein
MNNNIYYIYIHERLDTGLPFYVGKGKRDRDTSNNSRNNYWHNIVNKHGFRSRRIQENMSNTQANNAEKLVIAAMRKRYSLVNITNGGEGASFKRSAETCKKIRDACIARGAGRRDFGDISRATAAQRSVTLREGYRTGRLRSPTLGVKRDDLAERNKLGTGKKWYSFDGKSKQFFPDQAPEPWALGRIYKRKK